MECHITDRYGYGWKVHVDSSPIFDEACDADDLTFEQFRSAWTKLALRKYAPP